MNGLPGDNQTLYECFKSHDARFDGRFFAGVSSSGIYCRPICSARVPKFENCTFFAQAAGAEKAGYRPCLLCRPELAPGDGRVGAPSRLAGMTLRRIEDGALNAMSVETLADEFGVTARHLRRALSHEFGVTPVELAQTQRLLHAKQLLSETELPVTEVAFAAGFQSPRRFNDVFKTRYRLAPQALRRANRSAPEHSTSMASEETLTLRIDYRPPYHWAAMCEYLTRRAIPGVEAVRGDAYIRTLEIGDHCGWLKVQPLHGGQRKVPIHALAVTLSASLRPMSANVIAQAKALFDTRASVAEIEQHLRGDELLEPSISAFPGLRLPGAFNGFELIVRAVLGQQVSVKGASTLAGRWAAKFGRSVQTPFDELTVLTPTAGRVARARIETLAALGLPLKRAETIQHVARAVADDGLLLVPGIDPDITHKRMLALPGIGEWTASYVAMRALAWPDAFPFGDLGLIKAIGMKRPAEIAARARQWSPWRGYAAMHLWKSLALARNAQ
ncbi:MAG: AraC family transcriptional regulator of adaptative response / DNA-3-methyladenine glycosylase II [Gammaproteobacteria bacterium]|jgi:AraC family transcriptional regulator of adaptative response / DNA-3-methyladenine glycosylase II